MTPPQGPALAQTTVAIVTAAWEDGAATVTGFATVVEDGGTCTATVMRDGVEVAASRPATADATTTVCGLIEVQDPRLTAGTWDVVLSYTSPTSVGASSPTSLTIG